MTIEHKCYLKKIKRNKLIVLISQISLLAILITLWEVLTRLNIIDSFLFSSPSKIINTLIGLYQNNNLFNHILATSKEVIISVLLCGIISIVLALILYSQKTLRRILEPFIMMINSLPKIALGPIIIIWLGTDINAIIFNALLISVIVTTITILNGFLSIDPELIKLFKIYGSSKKDILLYLIIPSSKEFIISSLKINISMNLIGVIMGEFLCCKEGIGYLILYGTQVFNLSLVMCGILLLSLLSIILNSIISFIEKL